MIPNTQFPLNPAAQPGTNQQVNGWVDHTAQHMPQLQGGPQVIQPPGQLVAQPLAQPGQPVPVPPVPAPVIQPGNPNAVQVKPMDNPANPHVQDANQAAHAAWLANKPPATPGMDNDAYRAAINAWHAQRPAMAHAWAGQRQFSWPGR